jgi:hypothetical protein
LTLKPLLKSAWMKGGEVVQQVGVRFDSLNEHWRIAPIGRFSVNLDICEAR